MVIGSSLWPGGNVVASHSASQVSTPDRVNFLVEVFPGPSLNCKTNVRKFRPHCPQVTYGDYLSSKPYSSFPCKAVV